MKKIISILAFTVLPTVAYSQLPLVEYKPVIVGKVITTVATNITKVIVMSISRMCLHILLLIVPPHKTIRQ